MTQHNVRSEVGYVTVGAHSELIVRSVSDLPQAVAGVITVPDNLVVRVLGMVDLGADRLVLGSGSCIIGSARPIDAIIGSTAGNLITATTDTEISQITITAPNGTGLFVNSAAGDMSLTDVNFSGCTRAAHVTDVEELTLAFVDTDDCAQGFLFDGTVALLYSNGLHFHDMAGTAVCVDFAATANITSGLFSAFWFEVAAGQIGLRVDAAATIGKGVLTGSSFTGAGTFTSPAPALMKADPRITMKDNAGVPSSTVRGGIAFTGNAGGVETVIATVDVFVAIGTGNAGTHPEFVIDANSERTTLQGTTAPTQEIRYTGLEIYNALATIALSIETPSRSTGAIFSARLLLNGSPVANSEFQSITGGRVNAAGSLTFSVPLEMSEDDDLQVQIANNDDNSNLIVVACRLLVT